MATQDVASVYHWVIDDVITKMKAEFVQEGVEESVLLELRQLWGQKLAATCVADDEDDDDYEEEDKQESGPGPSGAGTRLEAVDGRKRKQPDGVNEGTWQIPQQDGTGDDAGPSRSGGGGGAADGAVVAGEPQASEPDSLAEEHSDDINLSDDEEVLGAEGDEEELDDYLTCLFTKVHKTKARWKAALKAGVFHLNGRDYLFKTANGEFHFT